MLGRSRRALIASCLALGMALNPLSAWARGGEGATEGELAAARSLFAEAFKDEEAKRFADALDKFQRVRSVRDTAQVEYRIGSCYEGLGQQVPAYVAYREATVLGRDDVKATDVVAAAIERLRALTKHLGSLTLSLPARSPPDMQVRLDDTVMPLSTLSEPIVLEPGPHFVSATAADATPFRSSIVLPEGAHMALTISLEPRQVAAPEPARPEPFAPVVVPARRTETPPRPRASDTGRRTAGWITVGTGGVLLGGAAAVAIARSRDLSMINAKCTNEGKNEVCSNVDSPLDRTSFNNARNRINVYGPLALSLGAAGLVAAGVGTYLVLSSRGTTSDSRARSHPALRVTFGFGGAGLSGVF
jgi:hypothetical protein